MSLPRPVFFYFPPGPGLLHQKQHRHRKPDQRNQIHRQFTHREVLLQRVGRGGPLHHRWSTGEPHLQHRRCVSFILTFSLYTARLFTHSFKKKLKQARRSMSVIAEDPKRDQNMCFFFQIHILHFVWFLICSSVFDSGALAPTRHWKRGR